MKFNFYIDETHLGLVTFALTGGGKPFKRTYKIQAHHSYRTLSRLDEFFKVSGLKPSGIKKIIANKGPGSFTGTRMGAAHALALGFALNVPVRFLDKNSFKIR
jgi:tRNA A37 threonylcarbamoyladenosine modification protein TsaB